MPRRGGVIIAGMFIYAGIDEAGYGPLFGPLVVARSVLRIPKLPPYPASEPPLLWQRLSKAVARNLRDRQGRIVINDSKKLTTKAVGIKHLELGCLSFAALDNHEPADVGAWLDLCGECHHRGQDILPWYEASDASPWQPLPAASTDGELAIARGMLRATCQRIGIELASLGAAVVYEDQFNREVALTHSKAAVSFTRVAAHMLRIWRDHGQDHPLVIVDRQGGRTSYRELLAMNFPEAAVNIHSESPACSAYTLTAGDRRMSVTFQVEAEQAHLPVALASMAAKYTRELLMGRFNAWFTARCPAVRPTKGYGTDGQRFGHDIHPHLPALGIPPQTLRRQA